MRHMVFHEGHEDDRFCPVVNTSCGSSHQPLLKTPLLPSISSTAPRWGPLCQPLTQDKVTTPPSLSQPASIESRSSKREGSFCGITQVSHPSHLFSPHLQLQKLKGSIQTLSAQIPSQQSCPLSRVPALSTTTAPAFASPLSTPAGTRPSSSPSSPAQRRSSSPPASRSPTLSSSPARAPGSFPSPSSGSSQPLGPCPEHRVLVVLVLC
jgi:hypothetical protein